MRNIEQLMGHLARWALATLHDDERDAVVDRIIAFITEHPDVVERGDSWMEIRRLAERSA